MTEACKTISENLKSAKKAYDISKIVSDSQLEEIAEYILNNKTIKAEEKRIFFENAFQKGPLCAEYLTLCALTENSTEGSHHNAKSEFKVAVAKSPVAKKAFNTLTHGSKKFISLEYPDLRSACESVANDKTSLCILPVCSSRDGYYPTFSKLLKTYDLKIVKQGRIMREELDEELSFALLSKHLIVAPDAKNIMFSFTQEERTNVFDVILAIRDRCKIQSINSTPLEYNMDRCEFKIEVYLTDITPLAFIDFLDSALPGHTLLGAY